MLEADTYLRYSNYFYTLDNHSDEVHVVFTHRNTNFSRAGLRDVPTIDLRIDYLRPATPGSLTATGRAVRVGRSVAVADIEVVNEAGTAIAIGRGLFKA